jgi:hypothetical protein
MKKINALLAATAIAAVSASSTATARDFTVNGTKKVISVCALKIDKDTFTIGWSGDENTSDKVELTMVNNDPTLMTRLSAFGLLGHSQNLLDAGHVDGNGWNDDAGHDWKIKFTDTADGSHTVEGDMSKTVMDGHKGAATVEYFSKLVSSDEGIEAGEASLSVSMRFACL